MTTTTYDTRRWQADIGLEIHCQLQTRTRLFSPGPLPTTTETAPNSLLTPFDLGLPGTLPQLNERAVDLAIVAGIALGCDIAPLSHFDRKHYLYPDLPRGYQITQQERPICQKGRILFEHEGQPHTLPLQRIHLEEDAGRSLHEKLPGHTLVDLNRAGTPLIEIVTAPELHCPLATEAALRALHRLMVWLKICDGNLQEGSMRFDANISVRPAGSAEPGVRCELKNLNSFRFVREALTAEIDRHIALLQKGQPVRSQTRAYDDRARQTLLLRERDALPDYRFLRDPDLPPLQLDAARIKRLRERHPEHPDALERRLATTFNLPATIARTLSESRARATFFENATAEFPPDLPDQARHARAQAAANLLINTLLGLLDTDHPDLNALAITPAHLASIATLLAEGELSATVAAALCEEVARTGVDPLRIVEARALRQCRDPELLGRLVDEVLRDHPDQLEAYRRGKTKLLGFFIGQAMRRAKVEPDPQLLTSIFRERLS
ncbi:Asp-tRNA(Asn)/Glu-tRNA(Gln) amidotransferase subunit GatB [Lujinxingia sediminis]|uniref:Aspartyl/glutamyl-tRNA(Asn/Gln) amidotransferase subunit B n=1 Tax=Lujinxingia sediminis TaxID=2480984 RepID=A0ABY0CNQ5_9DELT|nr:Asp-tRNA(Asn)/Glu-tRNA(Gln) amidotransferase subunit GatB [Lujinxingia sediminis]RVU41595.1 Asp-tRNA(Asn)/Glu-tRNA(Gln) amidotransferase subunit GatB [Lujinxingia sediminis]